MAISETRRLLSLPEQYSLPIPSSLPPETHFIHSGTRSPGDLNRKSEMRNKLVPFGGSFLLSDPILLASPFVLASPFLLASSFLLADPFLLADSFLLVAFESDVVTDPSLSSGS
ncbi:hypothetical protein AVEN_108713-1 [Araneus ventricosus]|uniref:Uncharacterized protein n=1 Tax=Araneus ventricosus TaxID=182803 RepID=A0A4Y2XCI8_ARAVE|nr:hypothetical protein AVEN_108713-1 [Araneus ventricosus]